jgi:hypothetical protein
MPVIPAMEIQEDQGLRSTTGKLARPCMKNKEKKGKGLEAWLKW